MKLLGYSGPVILLLVGVAGLVVLSSLKKDPAQKAPTSKSVLVEVSQVVPCESGFNISVDGEVIPFREITMSAQVGGRISEKSMKARAGNYVRQGDLLFQIDPRDYELQVRDLQQAVNQAESNIEEADVEKKNTEDLIKLAEDQLELQRKQVARLSELRSKNATSVTAKEQAQQAELTSLNALQTLKGQINSINARRNRLLQAKDKAITGLDLAVLNLDRSKIESPLEGVVIQDFAEQDDFVQPGTRLIRLEDTSKVEVRFNLRMDQLRWLWNSDESGSAAAALTYKYDLPKVPVEVSVELDGNEFTWPARLDRYDGAGINAGTRTVPVIAVVDDPRAVKLTKESDVVTLAAPPTLLRGSYVRITIPVGKNMKLVAVPATAYQPDKTVWVYEEGKLRIQPVRVAYSDQQQVIVMADPMKLSEQHSVVTSPLPVAEDGMAIRLEPESYDDESSAPEETLTASEPKTTESG